MLEQLISRDDTRSALRSLGPYRLIHELCLDDTTVRTETMPAALLDQDFIRVRVSHFSKNKRSSCTRSMVWPVNNADNPVELAVMFSMPLWPSRSPWHQRKIISPASPQTAYQPCG